jgi:hypothetical protein
MIPTEAHLKLLRNLAAGRPELSGFILEEKGLQAFYQCILHGWVDRGQLMEAGRQLVSANPRERVAVTIVKVEP